MMKFRPGRISRSGFSFGIFSMSSVPTLNISVKYWNVQREVVIVRGISVRTEGIAGDQMRGEFFESGRILNAETNSAALVGSDEPRPLERVHASHGRRKCDAKRL